MSNPTWKKTAEKMVPPGFVASSAKPSANLSLDWVHGYRGFDCRNNLRFLSEDHVVFSSAGLVIGQKVSNAGGPLPSKDMQQVYFGEHSDDVLCLAASGSLVASGEIGKAPAIHLYRWTAAGVFQSLACMKGYHTKGVVQVAFSLDGTLLFSVGVDYTVAIYDCMETKGSSPNPSFGKLVSSGAMKGVCLHVSCLGKDSGSDFVSMGEKHVVVWRNSKGSYKQEQAKLGEHKNKTFLCAARLGGFGGDSVAVGTNDGDLIVLKGTAMASTQSKVHDKALNALWSSQDGCQLVSGGRDGKVILWAKLADDIVKISSFSISSGKLPPAVRSVCMSDDRTKVLIGTQTCEILQFEVTAAPAAADVRLTTDPAFEKSRDKVDGAMPWQYSDATLARRTLVSGHFLGELWGLAVHPEPSRGEYCTVGDDMTLRIWSIAERRQKTSVDMGAIARCCAYSPDGSMIAVGYGKGKSKEDGMFRIYRVSVDDNGETPPVPVYETKEAKQWIGEIKFSPDGRSLAVGSHDNSIYLYGVQQQFKRKAKFSKHNSFITHLDFSADSKVVQSNCGAYELLFSDAGSGAQISKAETLKEVDWGTWTCPLGDPLSYRRDSMFTSTLYRRDSTFTFARLQ